MNINDFELYIDELILKRGRDYYKSACVTSLEYDGTEWTANVEGSDDYTVVVTLSDDYEILISECDCPYEYGKYCKHKVAVFYAVRDKIASGVLIEPAEKSIKETLKNLSKQSLLNIILDFANTGTPLKEEYLLIYAEKENSMKAAGRRKNISVTKGTNVDSPVMDWQKSINKAIDYIESNLADAIDYSAAARYMNCSVWEFQRLFSFMAQVPLSEYIRRRRLTLAAYDIQIKKDKILDVALRYGYDSHTSFSRAFTQLHGTTPKSIRSNGVTLKVFPRLDFRFVDKGAAPANYRIEQKEAFQVIGITKRFTMHEYNEGVGKLWAYWYYNKLKERFFIKYAKAAKHDMCVSTPIDNTDEFYYTVGFLYSGVKNTDGFSVANVPGGTYIVFDIPDEYVDDDRGFMQRCAAEYIPAAGYKPAGTQAEYFHDSKKSEAWFLVR
jgi:AraC family transcriptional regulator